MGNIEEINSFISLISEEKLNDQKKKVVREPMGNLHQIFVGVFHVLVANEVVGKGFNFQLIVDKLV
ncbi:hypothetical protein [Bacillus weihaiensis]|uniref:Uncharacterized protein n=1 Tax=Bacillus weihaiensis TaxID=1547283 RepID=A0A1L3MS28_9BACI|nr:hypothetical protein [Bacillus weihaiensis]APH05127.1 hypothetical protein A9C19_10400 [Bacillus weihaiensis]